MPSRNFLVLSIDGLQAGMLGPYGNTWIHTPAVNRLASQSFVFDQAFACDPSLNAVLQTLWTSGMFGDRMATLFTDDRGIEAHPLSSVFTEKQLCEPLTKHRAADAIEDTSFGVLLGQATEWLCQAHEPFSLWIHTRGMIGGEWDAPYALRSQYADEEDPPPPDFVEPPNRSLPPNYDPDELLGIQQAYAGQVSAFDGCLGALIEMLDELPIAKNTTFVLMGVRGFPLGEHRRVGLCDAALYNELTHVPLLVRSPDGIGALDRTQALVTHTDVTKWLFDELRTPYTASDLGLSALIQGKQIRWRDHLLLQSQEDRAIRTPAWYLRESGSPEIPRQELYVKPDDRHEVNDIADRCSEITSQLAEVLAGPPRAIGPPLPDGLVTAVD